MIHPSAIIDPAATLADDVEVGPYAVIDAEVTIGRGTRIGSHVVIRGPTRIGEGNRIFQFASVGEDPQDLKYAGERTELVIGDRNRIREFATINRGTGDGGGFTKIGNDNLFMAYIHVAHDCIVGDHCIMANCASLAGHVILGNHAILGGFAGVHQFMHVGEHAFIGLNSVVNKDVPPFTLVQGSYATARSINTTGLKRRGFDDKAIAALRRAYKAMLRGTTDRASAVTSLADDIEAFPEVRRFVDFIETAPHGVMRGERKRG
ncbi:MAG: acyl-[acyl-carrier-protein]--UDP-N-acetylglucosamine O-acyltransferase [Gammaproteobacteria bacterium]|nr:MAG: acyl-[acyl-carrier-protein]--UDP-N-acetylglucosamine O-acyltransferase [Gammaproteobacteria bacterium]